MASFTIVVSGVIPVWFETTVEAPDAETAKAEATEAARMAAARHENGMYLTEAGFVVDYDGPIDLNLDSAEIVGTE